MSGPRWELSADEWAVLALLAEQPSHGFAIARALEREGPVGRVWSVTHPLVYRALERLSEDGLAPHGRAAAEQVWAAPHTAASHA
jgi:DNA-binding PadR family transcriptional regulator